MAPHPRLRGRAAELQGRRGECTVLDGLVEAVRAGESRALVLFGEAGSGKTALLDYLAWHAPGCQVARAAGVQSEMELAFAAVHQLCAPMLGHLERLPGPQREALSTAFGLSAGPPPDRFLIGMAVLGLLSDVAGKRPLMCLVDDQQWLDRASAQVLAFVARRLEAESVGLVFAVREAGEELGGLPELIVEGLRDDDARALLNSARTGDVAAARAALAWLAERTRVSPTDWALGIEARVRALLSEAGLREGEDADRCHQESISRLGRTRLRAELARAHLLYGEWLRREHRRAEAREQLRTAHEMLDTMGMKAFAERARRELTSAGEPVRNASGEPAEPYSVPAGVALTAQEALVARLARDGLSNPEIGSRLFISSRTVQYHLRKVFTKLGISSRGQLYRVLPSDPASASLR